jgi:nucleotide-binding universal stress UspA family protein
MKRYERILVCIDRVERDARMLAYVRAIGRLAESREICLLHVSEAKASGAADTSANVSAPAEITVETLGALVGEHFEAHQKEVCRCEVVHGAPLLEVLRFAHDKEVDLIVVGREFGSPEDTHDDALLARRITRKSTCSVLVLPEEHRVKADTILVPVRDSECSANALEIACEIGAATEAAVIAFNVYRVHTGYSRVGTTLEEHQALLEAAAQRECGELLKRLESREVEVECKFAPDLYGKPVSIILEAVASESADLVVIGARGRSGAAGVLLGTVTEQLIRESPVPVLAVKKKGECLGLLRALLTLAGEG